MKRITIIVLICVAGVFGVAQAQNRGKAAPKGFVITYLTRRATDANRVGNELAVRMVSANGRWKETRWRDTGKTETVSDGTHVYLYSDKKATLEYEGSYGLGAEGKAEPLSEIPNNASSTGVMLGVKAYSVRNQQPDGSYIETTYSLETGAEALRTVVYFPGRGKVFVREAVSLHFRPIKDEELAMPDRPISFAKAERELEEMRNSGNEVGYLEEAIKAAKAEAVRKQR